MSFRNRNQLEAAFMHTQYAARQQEQDWEALAARAEPPPAFRLDTAQARFSPAAAERAAEEALAAGKLKKSGAVTLRCPRDSRLSVPGGPTEKVAACSGMPASTVTTWLT